MFCIFSTPNLDVQAIVYDSAYIGIPYSTAHTAQSSQASCPSTGWPPYSYVVVVEIVYP
jgi:uncharacterized metal-binding protein YceD (DUF177 family)